MPICQTVFGSKKCSISSVTAAQAQIVHSVSILFENIFSNDQVGRSLMAVLLKHHDLGHVALSLVEHGLIDHGRKHGLPRSIAEICKVVHQAKRSLIKVGTIQLKFTITKRSISVWASLYISLLCD